MSNPTAAVLDTSELLEMIMLHIPPQHIFVVQRVSKTWQDMVSTSKAIRQLCFLEPQGVPVEPQDPPSKSFLSKDAYQYPEMLYLNTDFKLNPSIEIHPWGPYVQSIAIGDGLRDRDSQFTLPEQLSKVPNIYRAMFFTQPPCTTVTALVSKRTVLGGYRDGRCIYRDEQGVKLGKLLDWVAKNVRLHKFTGTRGADINAINIVERGLVTQDDLERWDARSVQGRGSREWDRESGWDARSQRGRDSRERDRESQWDRRSERDQGSEWDERWGVGP